jgi:hypothetical protein
MLEQFSFDENKTAQENIEAFVVHIESTDKLFGGLLRKHLDKMVPLPDQAKRSAARASFNLVIKQTLDAVLATRKAKRNA